MSTSTVATGTSLLDVQTLVTSLMTVEKQPMVKLDARISAVNTRVSAIGNFMSKVGALQTALTSLGTASTFATRTASSTNPALVGVTASASATVGDIDVSVQQSARAQQTLLTKAAGTYATATAAVEAGDFTVGGQTFTTVAGDTLSSLAAKINAYQAANAASFGITAAVVQRDDSSWGLLLTGTRTGVAHAFAEPTSLGSGATALTATTIAATDAAMTVNGVAYTRSANTFADVMPGITLQINQAVSTATTARVTVSAQNASAASAVQSMVTAYNGAMTLYKSLTAASVTAASRGVLNGDASIGSFMSAMKSMFDAGAFDSSGRHVSWSSAGVTVQRDGTLSVNTAQLNTALAGTLGTVLANGLMVGSTSAASDLRSFIRQSVASNGLLGGNQTGAQETLKRLNSQRTQLDARLVKVQAAYTRQYAALDAQLTKMNRVSQNLASTLDAMSKSSA